MFYQNANCSHYHLLPPKPCNIWLGWQVNGEVICFFVPRNSRKQLPSQLPWNPQGWLQWAFAASRTASIVGALPSFGSSLWGFHSRGTPIADWFIIGNSLEKSWGIPILGRLRAFGKYYEMYITGSCSFALIFSTWTSWLLLFFASSQLTRPWESPQGRMTFLAIWRHCVATHKKELLHRIVHWTFFLQLFGVTRGSESRPGTPRKGSERRDHESAGPSGLEIRVSLGGCPGHPVGWRERPFNGRLQHRGRTGDQLR